MALSVDTVWSAGIMTGWPVVKAAEAGGTLGVCCPHATCQMLQQSLCCCYASPQAPPAPLAYLFRRTAAAAAARLPCVCCTHYLQGAQAEALLALLCGG